MSLSLSNWFLFQGGFVFFINFLKTKLFSPAFVVFVYFGMHVAINKLNIKKIRKIFKSDIVKRTICGDND